MHALNCINPVADLLLKKVRGDNSKESLVSKVYGGIKDKDKAFVLAVSPISEYAFVEIEIPNSKYDNAGCLTDFLYVDGYDFDSVFKKATYDFNMNYTWFVDAVGVSKIYETENN